MDTCGYLWNHFLFNFLICLCCCLVTILLFIIHVLTLPIVFPPIVPWSFRFLPSKLRSFFFSSALPDGFLTISNPLLLPFLLLLLLGFLLLLDAFVLCFLLPFLSSSPPSSHLAWCREESFYCTVPITPVKREVEELYSLEEVSRACQASLAVHVAASPPPPPSHPAPTPSV